MSAVEPPLAKPVPCSEVVDGVPQFKNVCPVISPDLQQELAWVNSLGILGVLIAKVNHHYMA